METLKTRLLCHLTARRDRRAQKRRDHARKRLSSFAGQSVRLECLTSKRQGRNGKRQGNGRGYPLTGPANCGWPPTPMTGLGVLRSDLLSDNGLESALLEGIALKHETVSCHHGMVLPRPPMETRTVPWLHSVRLPPRGRLPNGRHGEQSVLSRCLLRCVSFSPLKSGNKPNKPLASTVATKEFFGHCNPLS